MAPTDALAATSSFRRLGVPRRIVALVEGESLFNDATALVADRTGVLATMGARSSLSDAFSGFVAAAVGGVAIGLLVGAASAASCCAGSTTRRSRSSSRW